MSAPDHVKQALDTVLQSIPDPRGGVPDPLFEFLLKVTTMINVDLLIQEPARGILLTWRDDDFGTGWHIPGGIIRLHEPLERRLAEVARLELGATIEADAFPCDIQQFFRPRGHFISLLYRCRLTSSVERTLLELSEPMRSGTVRWFQSLPVDIYPGHEVYSAHFAGDMTRT